MPNRVIAAAVGVAVGLGPAAVMGQEIDILMTLPAATLTFSAPFIAEDAGFYRKESLKVSHRTIAGVGAVNAVIAGSADFTMGTGPVFLRAARRASVSTRSPISSTSRWSNWCCARMSRTPPA